MDPALLSQPQEVRVVVDHRGHPVPLDQLRAHRVVVPAGHADRAGDPTSQPVDWSGQSYADPAHCRPWPVHLAESNSAGELLQLFRSGRASTRTEVRRLTGLARSTVTYKIDTLLDAGYLVEDGSVADGRGRLSTRLRLNDHQMSVLDADLGATHGRLAVSTAAGEVLGEAVIESSIASGPDAVLDLIAAEFDRCGPMISPWIWTRWFHLVGQHCTNLDTMVPHCGNNRCGWSRCTCGALVSRGRRHHHPRHGTGADTCHDPAAAA